MGGGSAPAHTGAHGRALPGTRAPARPLGAAAESDFSSRRPAPPRPQQSPRGRPGTTARTLAPRAASSPRRCRLPRARGRRRPGLPLRSPAAAHSGGRSGRRRGAGGGGSGVAQAEDPARRRERLLPCGEGRTGLGRSCSRSAGRNPGPPPSLAARSPRGHRALTLRVEATGGEAQLLAGRTLRTLGMNDDSPAHLERARVTPVSTGAGPPWALRAATSRCGRFRGNLVGTVRQAPGPTPIPAGRALPASVGGGVCVQRVYGRRSAG